MNVFENGEIRRRLLVAFPKCTLSMNFELIVLPAKSTYIMLGNVEDEEALTAKILEWLSWWAIGGGTRTQQAYHFNGINSFLGTAFSIGDMETIYEELGNATNHEKTLRFIRSGYDVAGLHEPA